MNSEARLTLAALAGSLALAAGCAKQETVAPIGPQAVVTAARPSLAKNPGGSVVVSDDIARACSIDFNNVDRAPKFDFDGSALSPTDRQVLRQVATCVTAGPLAGRSLTLVGRADPRGELEYNMTLGEHRADSATRYLGELGVSKAKMMETSRGKLDAIGTDEGTWQADRRVDVLLR